ncbi:unnamed protein product [Lupinus luteus]|uniref:Uncharacterized protein n=1 Tax=Lupinus luteus TaxID=3873 RepID=A0AAV1Y3U2_LUPLU
MVGNQVRNYYSRTYTSIIIDRWTNDAHVKEFGLKQMWKSPNGTIRNILNAQNCSMDSIWNNDEKPDACHYSIVIYFAFVCFVPAMDENATSFSSHQEYSDFSTGYLEDAFIEFTSEH